MRRDWDASCTDTFSRIQQIHRRARLSPTSQDCGASGKMYFKKRKILLITEKKEVRVVEVGEMERNNLLNTKVPQAPQPRLPCSI